MKPNRLLPLYAHATPHRSRVNRRLADCARDRSTAPACTPCTKPNCEIAIGPSDRMSQPLALQGIPAAISG